MKMTMHFDREIEAVSLRSAWLINRALQARLHVAHFAFDFRTWRQGRDRIDDEHVDRARPHKRIRNFERLLAGVGLRNKKIVEIDAEFAGVNRVERMFRIDKGAHAASFLRFRDDVQRQRGLARRFRPVNLDYSTARQSADAERNIEPK